MAFLRKPHLWLALLVVLLAELALRTPLSDFLQSGASHTGRSLQLRNSLRSRDQIEIVTLGNSVAEYGINHQELGRRFADRGLRYASLAMPGSHLLTLRALTRYARTHWTELKVAVVVISLSEFETVGNGNYEMAIAMPWLQSGDWTWTNEHVRPQLGEPSTLGGYSALAGYRQQLQFLARNPSRFWKGFAWWRWLSVEERSWTTGSMAWGLCGIDTSTVANCLDPTRPLDLAQTSAEVAATVRPTCAQLLMDTPRSDWRGHDLEAESAVFKRMRILRQAQVRELPSSKPPLVVLLPLNPLWERERLAIGVRDWVDQIYAPLAANGEIRLLDLSRSLEAPGMRTCAYFGDMYHLNVRGQALITEAIQDAIDAQLLAPDRPSLH